MFISLAKKLIGVLLGFLTSILLRLGSLSQHPPAGDFFVGLFVGISEVALEEKGRLRRIFSKVLALLCRVQVLSGAP